MKTSLPPDITNRALARLEKSNAEFAKIYPGDSMLRQPLHTVYGGAHIFKADTMSKLGAMALRSMEEYAPDAESFAVALGLKGSEKLAQIVYDHVLEKLKREPVEDFRIDFEDGFGNRSDAEEDEAAVRAANETARGINEKLLSPFIGIRIKPFTEELKARSIRTLDIFVSTLTEATGGKLPDNFVVTLPKITIPEQSAALAELMESLETNASLASGSLKMEIMIETTQSIFNMRGEVAISSFVAAAKDRCIAAHFGTYDYTASCNITAAYQTMDHPSCDFARHVMKVSLGGTGIWLSDGATNALPVAPHRASAGERLTDAQLMENRQAVHGAWKLAYGHIRHSLKHGFYQGWDLHPAQLPVRYAACYAFFLEGLEAASERLKNFMEKAAQATLVGNVFDDAATGQGLLNYFLKALNSGAINEQDVLATGLSLEEVRGRSFSKIMDNRRKMLTESK